MNRLPLYARLQAKTDFTDCFLILVLPFPNDIRTVRQAFTLLGGLYHLAISLKNTLKDSIIAYWNMLMSGYISLNFHVVPCSFFTSFENCNFSTLQVSYLI